MSIPNNMIGCGDFFKIFTNKLLRSNKFLSVCFLLTINIVLLVVLIVSPNYDCHSNPLELKFEDQHSLCVIIPFRDRFDELLTFLTHMKQFLQNQNVRHHVLVVNQVDSFRFNRGSLINVGYLYARDVSLCNYMAMHDVDLLPLNPLLNYSYPGESIMHLAAPHLHPKYHYKTFLGAILLMKNGHFETLNGLSNKYWGWGLEDDELYMRIRDAGLPIRRPQRIGSGFNDTFRHLHDKARRRRDMVKCHNQWEVSRKRDRQTGLHNVAYELSSTHELRVDGAYATVLNVDLQCNQTVTPWCDCRKAV